MVRFNSGTVVRDAASDNLGLKVSRVLDSVFIRLHVLSGFTLVQEKTEGKIYSLKTVIKATKLNEKLLVNPRLA